MSDSNIPKGVGRSMRTPSMLNYFIGEYHVAPILYKAHKEILDAKVSFTTDELEIIYDEVRLAIKSMEDDGGESELIERYESVLRKL